MAEPGGLSPLAQRLAAVVAESVSDAPVVVALSGGPDSAALAWAVAVSGATARAVSVDHHLPGSGRLMDAAASIAARLELAHTVIPRAAEGGSETALRSVRLTALEANLAGDEVIVTGHTLEDQAETVLGNVLRGAGTTGLGGIPAGRGPFRRPLLRFRRAETRAVAAEVGLPFVDDPQNEDTSIRRNRLRIETIPELASAYNPRLIEALGRLGAAAAADDAELERRAAAVPLRRQGGVVRVPAASLTTLPLPVATRVARRALRMARGPASGTTIEAAAVLAAANGARSTIPAGIDVCREGPWVCLVRGAAEPPAAAALTVDQRIEFGDWTFSAAAAQPSVGRFSVSLPAVRRLLVRVPSAGDRIAIVDGSKPVIAALAEAGVPERLRTHWPLVEADGRIEWIAGVRAAPRSDDAPVVTIKATRRSG